MDYCDRRAFVFSFTHCKCVTEVRRQSLTGEFSPARR